MLEAQHVDINVGGRPLLSDLSLSVSRGQFLGILGPNGAGKSTLLSVLSGEHSPSAGEVLLDGKNLSSWSPMALACRRAVMNQHASLTFPFTVREVVALGLTPHGGLTADARPILDACMDHAHVSHLADRLYLSLSGGEKQRVHFARCLLQLDGHGPQTPPRSPQDPAPLFLLDEPTSSLDPGHQHLVLAAASQWRTERHGAVIAVLHDLTLAAQYCDAVLILASGKTQWYGPPRTLPLPLLQSVFGVSFHRAATPPGNTVHYVSMPMTSETLDSAEGRY